MRTQLAVLIGVTLALANALLASPANAATVPAFVKKGADYFSIRKKLPPRWAATGKSIRTPGGCPDYDVRCSLPEARECSGTGSGFCNMVWKHRDGTVLVITTAGDDTLSVFRFQIVR